MKTLNSPAGFEARVRAWVEKLLGHPWHVRIKFGALPDDEDKNAAVYANAVTFAEQFQGTVSFNLKAIFEDNDDGLDPDEIIRHELGHLLVSPLSEMLDSFIAAQPESVRGALKGEKSTREEQVVTMFARMPIFEEMTSA